MIDIPMPTLVYLMRKLGWTRDQIEEYTLLEILALADEVQYQDMMERYEIQLNAGGIQAMIANTTPSKSKRRYKARDFAGHMPMRVGDEQKLLDSASKTAKKAGLIGPPK